MGAPGHHDEPVLDQGREPGVGLLQERQAAAGEVPQELRRPRTATAATTACRRRPRARRPRTPRSTPWRETLGDVPWERSLGDWPGDHLRRRPRRPAAPRRRPSARHVLRRLDRRAGRAVGDDVRQLGGQGLLAAGRRARPREGGDAAHRPADPLARRRLPRCRPRPPVWSSPRATPRTPWCAAPTRSRPGPSGPTTSWCSPARCCPWACGSRTRSRPASTTSASRSGRSPTRSPPGTRPSRRDVAHDLGGAPVTQALLWQTAAAGTLVTGGGRLLVGGEPGFPTGTRLLHRAADAAAAPSSWSPRPRGNVSRRPRPPSASPPASLREHRTGDPLSLSFPGRT